MFGGTLKDKITNVISLIFAIGAAIQAYIATIGDGNIDWFTFFLTVFGAVIAWLTGKDSNGKAKKPV